MWSCAITSRANLRNRGAIAAMLAVPSVSIEKDQVRSYFAVRVLVDPEQPPNGGSGSALGDRV